MSFSGVGQPPPTPPLTPVSVHQIAEADIQIDDGKLVIAGKIYKISVRIGNEEISDFDDAQKEKIANMCKEILIDAHIPIGKTLDGASISDTKIKFKDGSPEAEHTKSIDISEINTIAKAVFQLKHDGVKLVPGSTITLDPSTATPPHTPAATQGTTNATAVPVLGKTKKTKKFKVGGKDVDYQRLGKGAGKTVYTPLSGPNAKAYSIPSSGILKERELKQEYLKMQNMIKDIQKAGGNINHLALDAIPLEGNDRLGKHYTLEVDRAVTDLEGIISTHKPLKKGDKANKEREDNPIKLNFQERMFLGFDLLDGLMNMHKGGMVHCDLKPENMLIYGNTNNSYTLKIADFGKSKPVNTQDTILDGNLRFAGPELKPSTASDVYGAALILIRILEEPYLAEDGVLRTDAGDPVIKIEPQYKDNKALVTRRGIEKLVVEHNAFPAMDNDGIVGKIRRFAKQVLGLGMKSNPKVQNAVLNEYIDALCEKMSPNWNQDQIDKLNKLNMLLKKMVSVEPKNRGTMENAFDEYNGIL